MSKKDKNLIRIVGSGGKGGSPREPFEADDNMFARQHAAFIDALAEGPIKGLVYGDASILIDETRLRDVNQLTGQRSKNPNFQNFRIVEAKGEATQTPNADFFHSFPSAALIQEIGSAELLLDEPQYHTISSGTFEKQNADYIKVTMSTSGMVKITKTGKTAGDRKETRVMFDIDFRWTDEIGVQHTTKKFATGFIGKVSGKYAHTFGFNIEEDKAGANGMVDWALKITRIGGEISGDTYEVSNSIYIDTIEASIADKLEYPYTAYIAGAIDAEAFSSVPARGYEIDGKLINIPSNHFPVDYNGRKVTVANTTNFAVGDSVKQDSISISTLTAIFANTEEYEGLEDEDGDPLAPDADDGYLATATCAAAHGITVGNVFTALIDGVSAEADFWEGTFDCEATTSTQFTYTLNAPAISTTNPTIKTLASTTAAGTKTATVFTGGIIDKIDGSTTLYLRNVSPTSNILLGSPITNDGSGSANVTAVTQVFIPANYRRNSSTEKVTTVEHDWDGTFYNTWCNNPAWVYNDLIINKIYGLGNYISQNQVNKWELYQIARYCDELVPAGVAAADLLSLYTTNDENYTGDAVTTNEYEPRFSCNLVIAGKSEAFKVLNDITGIFRGMTYWLNGEAYVVQDSEKDPVYQFTNGNVINGEFKYEGTANKTRTNQIIVNWNNPQDYYRPRAEIVELEETLQKDTEFLKTESITAFGCTSRGQARRLGKWKLLSNNLHTNTISFATSLNAAFLRPGDIIQVMDNNKSGKSWGGRVKSSSSTSSIKLDRQWEKESGYDYNDYQVTITLVGYKALLAQDTATIEVQGSNVTYVRGEELTNWRDSDNIVGTYTAVGSTSGSSTTVTLTADADERIRVGMYIAGTGITDYVDTVAGIDGTTLTLSTARTVSAATLTFGWEDADGDITIADEERAANVFDNAGNMIFVQWTPFTQTETKFIDASDNADPSSLTINTAGLNSAILSEAPAADAIWIISRSALSTGKTKEEARLYRTLQIAESDPGQFEIEALEYNATKFDAVDKNEALSQERQIFLPSTLKVTPPVTNISYQAFFKKLGDTDSQIQCLTFSWDPPRNVDDNALYTYVREYEIYYTQEGVNWKHAGNTSNTSIELENKMSGTYHVKIFTKSIQDKRSAPAEAIIEVNFQRAVGPSEGAVGEGDWTINKIGTISHSFGINGGTGAVAFTPDDFFHNDGINDHTVVDQATLAFSGLADNSDGYIYFDHSENEFIAIAHDTTSNQFYPVGSDVFASTGSTTGTLTCSTSMISTATANPNTIQGLDSTNFDGDLAVDNVLKFTNDIATPSTDVDYYHRVRTLTSDSEMLVDPAVRVTIVNSDNQAWQKPNFLVDYANDTIMGKVHRTNSTTYTLEAYGIRHTAGVYNINGLNEVHAFIGDPDDGEILASHYSAYFNEYTITRDGITFTFKSDGSSAANTFGLSCIAATGLTTGNVSIKPQTDANPGRITIADNSLDNVLIATATIRITDLGESSAIIADRVISFTKVTGGSGTVGANAKTVRLDASDYTIVYEDDGATPSPSGNIVLTATSQGLTNDGWFKFTGEEITPEGSFTEGTIGDPVTGDTFNFPVPALLSNLTNPATVKVEIQDGSSGGVIASDSITISAVSPGTDAYTVSQTNPTHAIPAGISGASPVLTGTGTIFEVFTGATNLLPKMSGTPGDGEYSVTAGTDTGITASTNIDRVNSAGAEGTGSTHNRVKFNAHTSLTASIAEIEYAVNCENKTTFIANQTFTRTDKGDTGDPAKTILVSPSAHIMTVFTEPEPEVGVLTTYNPSSITVRGITNNTTADGVWSSTSGAGSFTPVSSAHDADPGPSVTVSGAQLVDGMTVTYTLAVADGGGSDSTTLEKVDAGSSVINVIFTNESHTFITDSDGTSNPVYTGSGMDVYCYEGGGRLDYIASGTADPGEWKISQNLSGSGLTGLAITANGTTSGIQTLDDADHFLRVGVITDHTTGTDVSTVTYTITGKQTDGTVFSFTKLQTLTKAKRGATGDDAKGIQLILGSNEIAFDNSTGTPVLTPAVAVQDIAVSTNLQNITGTPTLTILAADGSAQSPADVLFTNGSVTIDATSATIDASSWDTVTLGKSVQVKASRVHDSVTYTDTQALTAVFSGETGDAAVTGFLTNESFTAPTAEGGDPVLTGGSGNMKIFIGATDDTSNWTFAGDATSNGLVFAVTEATGAYALSGTWTGTTASFDITASKSGYSNVVKTFTVAKSADGDTGKSNTTIYYLQTGFGIPSAPTNGTDETPGTWITTVPTAATGKSIWFSFGTKPSGSSTWTFTNPQFYLGDLVYTIPGILNINPGGTGLTILNLTTNDYLNDQTTWEDLTDSGSGNANIPADYATNNNVNTGNTAAKNALTGTAGDIFFDTTTTELYIWE